MTVFTQLFKNTQKVPALCLVKHDNDFLQTLPNPRYLPLKSCHRVFPPIQLAKRGRKTLAAFLGWLPSQRRHLCPSSSAGAPLSSLPLTGKGELAPCSSADVCLPAQHRSTLSHWSSSSLDVTLGKSSPANKSTHCAKGYP